jgi:hypothetical protein
VETAASERSSFQIAAVLPPSTTSFRKAGLRAEARYAFRVRAFFYGPASNLASATTPRGR